MYARNRYPVQVTSWIEVDDEAVQVLAEGVVYLEDGASCFEWDRVLAASGGNVIPQLKPKDWEQLHELALRQAIDMRRDEAAERGGWWRWEP